MLYLSLKVRFNNDYHSYIKYIKKYVFCFTSEEAARLNLSQVCDIKEERLDDEFNTIEKSFESEELFQDYDGCDEIDHVSDFEYETESHFLPLKSQQENSSKANFVPNNMNPQVVLERLSNSDIAMINNNEEHINHQSLMCDSCEEFFDNARALRLHKKSCTSSNNSLQSTSLKNALESFNLPEHEFIYKNPANGKDASRWFVTLIIPPYTYTKFKKDKKEGIVVFACNGCQNLPKRHLTSAKAELVEVDDEGRQKYRLITANQNHECQPSPVNHLHTKFLHNMQHAIMKDPQKKLFEIYQTEKNHLCEPLEDRMKEMFLAEVKPYRLFNTCYSNIRANLGITKSKDSLNDCDISTNKIPSMKVTNVVLEHRSQDLNNSNSDELDSNVNPQDTSMNFINSITELEQDEVKEESEELEDVEMPENLSSDNFQENVEEADSKKDLPEHEFVYRYVDQPKKWLTSLLVPPYVFLMKTEKENVGNLVYWKCKGCNSDKRGMLATSIIEQVSEDGKSHHRLISMDQNHSCQLPSPVNHLRTKFHCLIRTAIYENADKTLPTRQIYDQVMNEICDSLDPEKKELFLNQATSISYARMASKLKKFRLSLDPTNPFANQHWQCEICDYVTNSKKAFKNHKISAHKGVKPYQCMSCGKFFASKNRLAVHGNCGYTQSKG